MDEEDPPDNSGLFDGVDDAEGISPEYRTVFQRIEERPRGMLSHTDREYLLGLKDYEHKQSEANRRQDIRERIENGFEDFQLIWWLLNEGDRAKIFEELDEQKVLDDSLSAAISFMFLGLDRDVPRLEAIIEDGVYAGANLDKIQGDWTGDAEAVDVDIDIDYNPDVEALSEQVRQGRTDQLTPTELGVLVRAGELEPEDLDELADTEPPFPGVYFGGGGEASDGDETDGDGEQE